MTTSKKEVQDLTKQAAAPNKKSAQTSKPDKELDPASNETPSMAVMANKKAAVLERTPTIQLKKPRTMKPKVSFEEEKANNLTAASTPFEEKKHVSGLEA